MLRWYSFASAFYLLAMTEAIGIVDRLVYGQWDMKAGNKITQSFNLLLIVTNLALFGWGFRRTRRVGTGGVLALTAGGILLLSALWSIDPQTTIRRGILYLFAVIGAIGIAATLDADEFMDVLGLTCAISAVASILLLGISPGKALIVSSHDFIGIFSHKNVLGQAMAAGTLASLHGIRVGRRRPLNAVMLILFTAMGLAANSATSFMTIFAFCGLDGFITLFRKGGAARIMAIGAMVFLLPLVAVAVLFPDSLLEMIGKDPSLTGRTDLWAYILTYIDQKPLLGWGYSVFWSSSDAIRISTILGWVVPQAHNGLLELLLSIGIVGTAFFIFLWARNVQLALRCLRTPEKALAISSFLSCVGILLLATSESVMLEPAQISTSVFFITGLMCERALRAARLRRYPAALGYAQQ
jgi:exopolysaccharide production protein ExoQ